MVRVAVIAQTTGTANKSEQRRLGLGASDRVLRVTRVRRQQQSVAYEIVVLPLKMFPRLAPDRHLTADASELARDHGLALGIATERVQVAKASASVAAQLGITPGARVMRLDRVASTVDGMPLEWRVAFIAHP